MSEAPTPRVDRRELLLAGLLTISAAGVASACGPTDKPLPTPAATSSRPPPSPTPLSAADCATPVGGGRDAAQFGCVVDAGAISDIAPGQKVHFNGPKLWLVRFDAAQAQHVGGQEGAILAMFHRCNHLGCTVPWRPDFTVREERDGKFYTGWFLCPCHGARYDDAGVNVWGPSPRPLDTCALKIVNGRIIVDTGSRITGAADNPQRAIAT